MKAHWQYLRYFLVHKRDVFAWCCRYGIPLAGIVHDLSKFHPREWFPYVDYFYGGPWPESNHGYSGTKGWVQARFDAAWLHHIHSNPHHHQYWVLRADDGKVTALPMPDRYRREMLADWRGAGMAINGEDEPQNWYLKNRENMLLHPETRRWVEYELGLLATINGEEFSLVELQEQSR